jgi:hypothetical protein
VYMRGHAKTCLIPIKGYVPVELKSDGAYVVWPGSIVDGRPYTPLNPRPQPLPEAPSWLLDLIPQGPVGASGRLGLVSTAYWYGVDPQSALDEVLGGSEGGRWHCPDPAHVDATASVNLDPGGQWVCSSCKLTGRLRALVGAKYGIGERRGNAWGIDSGPRKQVKAICAEMFPSYAD